MYLVIFEILNIIVECRVKKAVIHLFKYVSIGLQQEITKKVEDVLAKTPLIIQPRRELPRLAALRNLAPLVDLSGPPPQESPPVQQSDQPTQQSEPPLEQIESVLSQGDALLPKGDSLLEQDDAVLPQGDTLQQDGPSIAHIQENPEV